MKPKILIVGRVAWTETHSTLSSIFQNYPPDRLAYICIETKIPDFNRCANHFQISEYLLAKKLFLVKTPIGHRRIADNVICSTDYVEKNETSIGGFIRKHRTSLFLYLRELLWYVSNWKTKELREFIDDFSPDYLFLLGDPLPLMSRLEAYVLGVVKRPACVFIMDDIWTYKNGISLYRCLLRRQVRKLIPRCDYHFVISELMKQEYDRTFGIDSTILTKGVAPHYGLAHYTPHNPIRFIYVGQLIYGRYNSLLKVAEAIERLNAPGSNSAELHIYTQTIMEDKIMHKLTSFQCVKMHKPVPYTQVSQILSDADVVLFLESLERKHRYTAWLSFSTKITDYLECGKCIFAVGDASIAPIAYLREHNAAVVCDSYDIIGEKIDLLMRKPDLIQRYAANAYDLGQKKHSSTLMQSRMNHMLDVLGEVDKR